MDAPFSALVALTRGVLQTEVRRICQAGLVNPWSAWPAFARWLQGSSPGMTARARKAMLQDAIAVFTTGRAVPGKGAPLAFEVFATGGRFRRCAYRVDDAYLALAATFFLAATAFAGAFGFAAALAGLARAAGAAAGSAFAGFAVGPVESLLTFWPILLLCIPAATHYGPLYFGLVTAFVLLNFYLHCGVTLRFVEAILPRLFVNTSAFHNQHHSNAEKNFGEAFTLWDYLCRTRAIDPESRPSMTAE